MNYKDHGYYDEDYYGSSRASQPLRVWVVTATAKDGTVTVTLCRDQDAVSRHMLKCKSDVQYHVSQQIVNS